VVPATVGDPQPVRVGERPFLPPSPNLNCLEAQLLYPGTCLVEGTNLSEGRGTAVPFQVVGAPWLEARSVVEELAGPTRFPGRPAGARDEEGAQGVVPRAVKFVPASSKHAGQLCEGVFLHVVAPEMVRPVALAVELLSLIFARHPEASVREAPRPGGRRFIDLLWGSAELGDCLEARQPLAQWPSCEGYRKEVAADLLY
jgi:uncharacterized protein YbbC (DUF1343 family)